MLRLKFAENRAKIHKLLYAFSLFAIYKGERNQKQVLLRIAPNTYGFGAD